MKMIEQEDGEGRTRGYYRLGQIDQQLGLFQESLEHFTMVRELDPTFCADIVNLRIAEVHYKLDQVEESL